MSDQEDVVTCFYLRAHTGEPKWSPFADYGPYTEVETAVSASGVIVMLNQFMDIQHFTIIEYAVYEGTLEHIRDVLTINVG